MIVEWDVKLKWPILLCAVYATVSVGAALLLSWWAKFSKTSIRLIQWSWFIPEFDVKWQLRWFTKELRASSCACVLRCVPWTLLYCLDFTIMVGKIAVEVHHSTIIRVQSSDSIEFCRTTYYDASVWMCMNFEPLALSSSFGEPAVFIA